MKSANKRVRKISAKPASRVRTALKDSGTRRSAVGVRVVLADNLKQRVKELSCLYGLGSVIETPGISLEEILQRAVALLPAAFQYPEIACARIVLDDKAYPTSNYSNTKWRLSAELMLRDERIGQVEVHYLKEKPALSEGVFLEGERSLIDSIAERLSRVIERKRAEAALKAKVEDLSRLATVVTDSNDAVIMHDFDGKILAWNRGAQATYGYTEAEALGKNVRDIVAEPDRDAALTLIENIKQGEVVKSFELRRIAKDGRILNVWLTTTLLRDEAGKPVAIATTERDNTERKQAEQEIMSLAKFPAENPNPVLRISQDGLIMYANAASAPLLILWGCAVGDSVPEFWRSLVTQALASMKTNTVEDEYQGRVYSLLVTPVMGADYVNVYGRDITERKQQEAALRENEIKYRIIADKTYDWEWWTDPEGKFIYCSPSCERVTGFSPDQFMVDATLLDRIIHPDDMPAYQKHRREVTEIPIASIVDFRVLHRDGGWRWIEHACQPVFDEGDHFLGTRGSNRDITDRKTAEDKVQKQLEQLAALSEIDRTIASTLDLRVSLSTLLSHIVKEPVVDAADILVINPASQLLEYAAGIGFRTNALQHTHLPLGEGYAGVAGLERRIVHVANLRTDTTDSAFARIFKPEDFEIYFGLPLLAKGKLLGVLEVFRRTPLEPDPEWLDFLNTLAGQAAIAIDNARLFDNMQRSNVDLSLAYDATITGWSQALDLRDKETEGHSQRVTEMALSLARLVGLRDEELVDVRRGALLHDIGKMGVPDRILLKPESLTDEEWVMMKRHPTFAFEMLSPIQYLHGALDIPYCHHEKWDGSGYPRGLNGEQIPLVARIFAVVDVWDALTSDRPYRPAWTKEKAYEHIQAEAGTHFDPQIVEVFLASDILPASKAQAKAEDAVPLEQVRASSPSPTTLLL